MIGVGDNLTWSYDADSDGEGEVEIGTGDTVTFSVPTGVTGAREITIYLRGDNGNAGETYSIVRDTLIRVISPNGGEGYNSGDTVEIQWETNTSVISDVDIFYSVNAGDTWEKINAESSVSISDSEWGEYPWVIPPGTESQECLIRVEKYEAVQASHRDMSDGVFSIGASDVVRAGISPQSYSGFLIAYSDGRVAITSGKNVFSQIELHDMRGRSSIRITNPESRRECSIPVRRHTMYLVRITAGGKTTTFPLVTIR